MKTLYLMFAACWVLAASAAAEGPGKTTGAQTAPAAATIAGKVFNAATGEPLRGARVELQAQVETGEGQGQESVTNALGEFSFKELKAGTYQLTVRRAGFVPQEYGEREAGRGRRQSSPITLLAGAQMRDLVFRLQATAVITGRVLDEHGEPLEGAFVAASQPVMAGQAMLRTEANASTDDRGEYRLFGLRPGAYVVSAVPTMGERFRIMARGAPSVGQGRNEDQAAPREIAGQTLYPGVLDSASASRVAVEAGQEIPNIDIRILKVRVFAVRGKVTLPAGIKPSNVHLMLWGKERGEGGGQASPADDGTFEILNVQPRAYRLMAMARDQEGLDAGGSVSGQMEIVVGHADVNDIQMVLGGGADISGRLRIEGRTELPRYTMVMLAREEGDEFGSAHAQVKEDGAFAMKGVAPGNYQVMATAGSLESSDYYLKEVRLGGRDVRESLAVPSSGSLTGLEILLGADGGIISGRVLNQESLPVAGAQVILLPPNPKALRFDSKHGRADQLGRFEIKGIRPGEYRVLAFDADMEELSGLATSEEAWKTMAKKGQAVQVAAAARQVLDVQVTPPEKP